MDKNWKGFRNLDTWAMTAISEKRLGTWERIILRRIRGTSGTARKWKIITN
jgi:hypothetical protein